MSAVYQTLEISATFLETLVSRQFNDRERARLVRALALLDTDEKHPSLRIHDLGGPLAGLWSASASNELRITFRRLPGGRKLVMTCLHHDDRRYAR